MSEKKKKKKKGERIQHSRTDNSFKFASLKNEFINIILTR